MERPGIAMRREIGCGSGGPGYAMTGLFRTDSHAPDAGHRRRRACESGIGVDFSVMRLPMFRRSFLFLYRKIGGRKTWRA